MAEPKLQKIRYEEVCRKPVLNMAELMVYLGIRSRSTIYHYIGRGLPCIQVGYKGQYRFRRDKVDIFMSKS